MRAGRRSSKVSIERLTAGRGTYGEQTETWAHSSYAWVNIKPTTGGETVQGGQIDATVTHIISLRKADLTANDRIVYGSRVFNITRVLNPEGRGNLQQALAIEDV